MIVNNNSSETMNISLVIYVDLVCCLRARFELWVLVVLDTISKFEEFIKMFNSILPAKRTLGVFR